jgi:PleD family two-component response regulator
MRTGKAPCGTIGKEKQNVATKKILLVDDSNTARLVTRMIFSQKSNYVLLSAIAQDEATSVV